MLTAVVVALGLIIVGTSWRDFARCLLRPVKPGHQLDVPNIHRNWSGLRTMIGGRRHHLQRAIRSRGLEQTVTGARARDSYIRLDALQGMLILQNRWLDGRELAFPPGGYWLSGQDISATNLTGNNTSRLAILQDFPHYRNE